jgi:hypothetical protein
VFSMPYDEDGPLTAERIREDVPDITMEHPAPVQVAGVMVSLPWPFETLVMAVMLEHDFWTEHKHYFGL